MASTLKDGGDDDDVMWC